MTFLSLESYADQRLKFSHINTGNSGLSYDGIRCMMRDSRGYVWIGTQKGLSRYDGARFKVFDRSALGVDSDYINSLQEDIEGNILIGTDRGWFFTALRQTLCLLCLDSHVEYTLCVLYLSGKFCSV
jgi:ligand-binding sensor domain-containing protein